jgi:hypothetical protein
MGLYFAGFLSINNYGSSNSRFIRYSGGVVAKTENYCGGEE